MSYTQICLISDINVTSKKCSWRELLNLAFLVVRNQYCIAWLSYSSNHLINMSCFSSLRQDLREQNLDLLLEESNKYREVSFKIRMLVYHAR